MDTRIDVLFKVEGQHITSASDVIITSGSRNYYHSVFEFDAVWLNLSPKAVFTVGKKSYIIPLNSIDGKYECVIPWEVIDRDTGFYVGAFGGDSLSSDLTFVAVSKGAQVEGELPQPPTPDWYNSIERLTDKAVNTATEVQQRADNGEFDGKPGKDGDNGKSAYEVAVEKGFIGTEEEWLASLHGKDGADGYTPVKGVDYFDGADGEDGVGIQSVEQTITSTADGGENEVTVTLTNGTKTTFKVKNGSKGSTGEKGEPGTSGADGSDANVTSENIAAALGYTPANAQDVTDLSEEIANYLPKFVGTDKVGKIAIVGTDGYITWIDMPEGSSGDVIGVVDEANNILLSGNLASGTYTMRYENEDGTLSDPVTMVVGAIVTYTITQNLTNVTSDYSAIEVREGESLTVNLTANDGYNMKSITVTMGGTDITSTAVSGGKISIASVTGDVVITAVAEEPNYTNLFVPAQATINSRINSSSVVIAHDGYVITNFFDVSDKTPFTADTKIYMKGATLNDDGKSRIFTYKTTGTEYTGSYATLNKNSVTITDEGNGVISISGLNKGFISGVVSSVMCLKVSNSAITTADLQNIIITIDEPIV